MNIYTGKVYLFSSQYQLIKEDWPDNKWLSFLGIKEAVLDTIKFKLTPKERDLILDHVLILDDEVLNPIKSCEMKNNYFVFEYSIEDLESLLESVAAQSNHSENRKIEQKLDLLYDKLNDIFESKI